MASSFDNIKKLETNHPLFVSAEWDDFPGCRENDSCGAWGNGQMRITDKRDLPECYVDTILAGAGCQICPGPGVTGGDIGVLDGSFTVDTHDSHEERVSLAREKATPLLASMVQSIIDRG